MRKARVFHIMAAVSLLVAIGLALGGEESRGNQQGPGINDRLGNLDALCRLNGGTPGSYSTDTVKTRHHCSGGYLDGLYCDVYADLTYCYWDKVGQGSARQEVTTRVEGLTFVTDLAADEITPITQETLREPMLVEAVVSWDGTADAGPAVMGQVNACRHLGGTEAVRDDGGVAMVFCEGGLLGGMWCSMGGGLTACFFEPVAATETAVASVATEVPGEVTVDAPVATETPTELPTEIPPTVEPTSEAVVEPTFNDGPGGGPWTRPDATLAPIEQAPTPTEAPLT